MNMNTGTNMIRRPNVIQTWRAMLPVTRINVDTNAHLRTSRTDKSKRKRRINPSSKSKCQRDIYQLVVMIVALVI